MIAAMRYLLVCACLLWSASGCADTSAEGYVELVNSSRECSQADQCALAGWGACVCARPVNKSHVEEVNEAAEEVECDEASISCSAQQNVRCDRGRCISDESR